MSLYQFDSSTLKSDCNSKVKYENCCQFTCLEEDLSLSAISKSFNSEELRKAVESLVMSRFGEEFNKKFEKSVLRQSKRSPQKAESSHEHSSGFSSQSSSSDTHITYHVVKVFDDQRSCSPAQSHQVVKRVSTPKSFSTRANSENPTSCSISAISELLSVRNENNVALRTTQYEFLRQREVSVETIDKIDNYTKTINNQLYNNPDLLALHIELQTLEEHIRQITNLINSVDGDNFSFAKIEAEKMLLTKKLKKNLLLYKIRNKTINSGWNIATINLSNLKFHIKPEKDTDLYFFCILATNSEIFTSDIIEPSLKGCVKFPNDFMLEDLKLDFEIKIQIYYGSQQKRCKALSSKKKKTTRSTSSPFFHLWGETIICIENINKVPSTLNSYESIHSTIQEEEYNLVVNVDGKANIKNTMLAAGFLEIGQRFHGSILWNCFWVVLYGSELCFYVNPIDVVFSKTIKLIDFVKMKEIQLKYAFKHECPRRNSLHLVCKNETDVVEDLFITAKHESEIVFWNESIFKVIGPIKKWNNLF